MWGGGEIDLREADFEDREVVIRCIAIMGGIHVTAPPELNVDVRGVGIMGGFGEGPNEDGETVPEAPRVRITGLALMGGVGVERKRTKAERRRLKEAEEAAGDRAGGPRAAAAGGPGHGTGGRRPQGAGLRALPRRHRTAPTSPHGSSQLVGLRCAGPLHTDVRSTRSPSARYPASLKCRWSPESYAARTRFGA
ncbi:hypothetical protein SMICM304S_05591 [Streptomyces microflavus]